MDSKRYKEIMRELESIGEVRKHLNREINLIEYELLALNKSESKLLDECYEDAYEPALKTA